MYHTGLDPITMKPVAVARGLRDRNAQRALLQFFRPENYFAVRKALVAAGRRALIGPGRDALIPDRPPAEALAARRREAQEPRAGEDHVHSTARMPGAGYRPGRTGARRRKR